MSAAAAMFIALAIDAIIGWPEALYRRVGHPVGWIGKVIAAVDLRLNRADRDARARRRAGALATLAIIGGTVLFAWAASHVLPDGWIGVFLTGVLAWPLVAARSLHDHVLAVAEPLAASDTEAARRAVSRIVGRNPDRLDDAAIARAGLESLAENTSDGVVAPLFWGALLGLPGIVAYKVINTLDSMIGHRTPRHQAFGWAAARIDDLVNLIPARLTGALLAAVSKARGTAFRTMLRDAPNHRSPNAGWPEAAMAGALGVRLSGPRTYGDRTTDDPWLNPVAGDPRPEDLALGLRLFRRTVLLTAALLLGLAVL